MLLNESGLKNFNKWMLALRSGDYEQALRVLVTPKELSMGKLLKRDMKHTCEFCCLGVATYEVGGSKVGYMLSDEDAIHLRINKTVYAIDFMPKIVADAIGIPKSMRSCDSDDACDIYVFVSKELDEKFDIGLWDSEYDFKDLHKGFQCEKVKASDLNDDYQLNFEQIADLLEFTYL